MPPLIYSASRLRRSRPPLRIGPPPAPTPRLPRLCIIARPPRRHRAALLRIGPPPVDTVVVAQQAAGFYRVADPTLAQYEVYVGTDADPDFTAPPAQTSASVPFTTSAFTAGHVYHLVVRQRDAWNLLSQNVNDVVFDLAGDGSVNPVPPSPPAAFAALPAAAGTVQVSAEYVRSLDGANAADTFLLFLTTDGSSPDPSGSPATTGPVIDADGTAKFTATLGPYSEGTAVKVLVRMRHTGTPNLDSPNTTPVTAIATLLGPAQPIGVASLGEVAE